VAPERAAPGGGGAALPRRYVERGRARAAQPIPHRGIAEVERRQDREQVATDVAAHVMGPELALDQLHGSEDRPFGTAGAKRRGTAVHLSRDRLPGFPQALGLPPPTTGLTAFRDQIPSLD